MHYCFLTSGTWEANASFVRLREFGNHMIARGHRISVITDDYPYNREKLPAVFNGQAEIRITAPSRGLGQVAARRGHVKSLRPDYVHVLNPFIKAYMALKFTGQKIVGDWDEWPAHRDLPFARKQMERFLDRWLRHQSSHLIVASRYLQEQFKERFGIEAAYIPYATYLQEHPDGESPFTEPTAVYMGNLYPAYDHDIIFEAARQLKAAGKSPRIKIMGMGPDLEKWRAFVQEHGLSNVEVPGFVRGEELWRNLRHAHVLMFPIRQTLLNLCRCPSKTFAYAQAGRPVITNRIGEVAQVLGDKATYIGLEPESWALAIDDALSASRAPDIDYGIDKQNWSDRTDRLLKLIETK